MTNFPASEGSEMINYLAFGSIFGDKARIYSKFVYQEHKQVDGKSYCSHRLDYEVTVSRSIVLEKVYICKINLIPNSSTLSQEEDTIYNNFIEIPENTDNQKRKMIIKGKIKQAIELTFEQS